MVRGGALIKAARKARGFTQAEIAEAYSDISTKEEETDEGTVGKWERFVHEPKYDTVAIIVTKICRMKMSTAEDLVIGYN
jgi:transcriptional regulator with XRE-family HTH domain